MKEKDHKLAIEIMASFFAILAGLMLISALYRALTYKALQPGNSIVPAPSSQQDSPVRNWPTPPGIDPKG